MVSEVWQYLFRQEGQPLLYAFLFLLLAAPSLGTIGVYVNLKHYNASIGTISHASLLGLGLAKYTGYHWGWVYFSPFSGMLLVSLSTAIILFYVELRSGTRMGSLLNVLWSTGMAIGILLLQTVPGGVNIHSYLWGNILIVENYQLWALAALNIMVLAILILPYQYQQILIFDREFAKSLGIPTQTYTFIFYLLVSYSIIIVISAVGILLSLGLLSIPSSIAALFARNFKQLLFYSCSALLLSSWLGLILSIELNVTPSSLIIVVLAAMYLLLGVLKYLLTRPKK